MRRLTKLVHRRLSIEPVIGEPKPFFDYDAAFDILYGYVVLLLIREMRSLIRSAIWRIKRF